MSAHQKIISETLEAKRAPLSWPLVVALIASVAMYLYTLCWTTMAPDMVQFVIPWYSHIVERGPVAAFAEPFSNYTPPYLYLLAAASLAHGLLAPLTVIKLLSVAGTGFLAFAIADLLKALGGRPKRAAFTFVVPTIALNAALLGQCDALWAGACVFAVAAMIRGRAVRSLVWCGAAIAFKAQAAFIAPFIIGALVGRRTPLWQWPIPLLVYAALMAPAWVMGWSSADLATVYLRQADWFDFPGNLANPWIWASEFARHSAQPFYAIGYAAAAAAAAAIGVLAAGSVRKPRAMLLLALLSSFALPFLLPKMHERYYFLAEALALALVLTAPTRQSFYVAAVVQLASLASVLTYVYFYWHPVPALVGALVAAMAIFAIYREALVAGVHWPLRTVLFPQQGLN
jgi:Gpi18-like mannosyltransferase